MSNRLQLVCRNRKDVLGGDYKLSKRIAPGGVCLMALCILQTSIVELERM